VKLGPGLQVTLGFVKRVWNNRFLYPGSQAFGRAAKSFAFPVFKTISRGFGAAAIAGDIAEIHMSLQPGGFTPNAFRAGAFLAGDTAGFFSRFAPPLRLVPAAIHAFDIASQEAVQSWYGIQE
jgi:hypothetical protein